MAETHIQPGDWQVIEETDAYYLTAEIRRAERETLNVDVSPHRVVVKSTAPTCLFERSVPLPNGEVDPERSTAHLNNGVLDIKLPKRVKDGCAGKFIIPRLAASDEVWDGHGVKP